MVPARRPSLAMSSVSAPVMAYYRVSSGEARWKHHDHGGSVTPGSLLLGGANRRESVPPASLGRAFRARETDPVERRLRRAASVADLRRMAKRRLPGGVFDYIDGGAEDERTLAANEAAYAPHELPAASATGRGEGRHRLCRARDAGRLPADSCADRDSPALPIHRVKWPLPARRTGPACRTHCRR